ncbi:LmeA family phospholipid-binding protein [Canibacter zhoujuaniae]|uniref:LmeA family phospholipid-binding protein n=2 Tax=Canibacter zhoujuaniae TaxID=2708343 RepID=UPI00141EC4E1|nr:LmeA family phospholipid-binding protein [Canibacter zhoujuaniae]
MSKRKRWLITTAVVVGIVSMIVAVVEIAGRPLVKSVAAGAIRENLHIPATVPVEVDLDGSLTWQLLTGKFRNVGLQVPNYTVADGVTVNVNATFAGIGVNPTASTLDNGWAYVSMTHEQFREMAKTLAGDWVDDVEFHDNRIIVHKSLTAFGSSVDASVEVQPLAGAGQTLLLNPVQISAGGITTTPEQLSHLSGGLLGEVASSFIEPYDICFINYIPQGLQLRRVAVTEKEVRASFQIDPEFLRDPQKRQPGTCAEH